MSRHSISICFATLLLLVGAIDAAQKAAGQVTMQFPVTKDLAISGFNFNDSNQQLAHLGGDNRMRVRKHSAEVTLLDFDTEAMATFLAENPGVATWTLNVFPSDTGFPQSDEFMPTIHTIESLNDWTDVETAANSNLLNLDWDPNGEEIPAATYYYAQTVIDPNTGEVDPTKSLPWEDPDSGIYTATAQVAITEPFLGVPGTAPDGEAWERDATPAFTNSEKFIRQEVLVAHAFGNSVGVNIDQQIIDAMINDENNRGLRFGPVDELYSPEIDNNWRIFSKEGSDGIFAAFLEVTVAPAGDGDFDADGDVDGADFLRWQRDLGDAASLALWQTNYGAEGENLNAFLAAVPEPSALVLLMLAGSAMLLSKPVGRSKV